MSTRRAVYALVVGAGWLAVISGDAVARGAPPQPPAAQTAQMPQARPSAPTIPGVETFHTVTTTIACGSDAKPESMAALKQAGFASAISLREDGEPGYDRAAVEQAAAAAGIRFIAIPLNRDQPDPAAARRFLDVISSSEMSPAFIYCRSGERAAAMWMIKRLVQDGWTRERALAEAEALGLKRPVMREFALGFAR